MISHEHKCIFIHVPRTGGSSIEKAIVGQNWWSIEKATKHLTALQAKQVYSECWDEYFKFAFVRNPWDRCISLLAFGDIYYGVQGRVLTEDMIEGYKARFGYPFTLEYDFRFYDYEGLPKSNLLDHAVYANMLSDELDFVGKYERLEEDFSHICNVVGVRQVRLPRAAASPNRNQRGYRDYYDSALAEMVYEVYRRDIEEFCYEF